MLGAAMAAAAGRPWKPYQRHIADVAGERLPDGSYAYPVVVVQIPRQSGKTTTAYDVALGRGRAFTDYRVRYSTHKGTITSDRFADWFLELERTPALLKLLKLRRSRGTEGIVWRRQGSYFQAFPARDGALRSAALDMVINDEAQEHDELLGEALKRTVTPVFTTRPRRQLWVVFSAGTDASVYAAEYLRKGLAGAPGYALFDYGCPEHVDPLDQDLWHTWHPGLAYGLTDHAALRMALAEGEAAFVREYGGIWARLAAPTRIPPAAWSAAQSPAPLPDPFSLGVDVAADRSVAAIVAASPTGHIEVLEIAAGVDWAASRLLELRARWGAPIAIDSVGPVGTVLDALKRANKAAARDVDDGLLVMQTHDVANAAAGFLDDLDAGRLRIRPCPELDDAVAAAATRPLGDAGFAWSRRTSAASIAPLVALCAALWGAQRLPDLGPKPRAYAA